MQDWMNTDRKQKRRPEMAELDFVVEVGIVGGTLLGCNDRGAGSVGIKAEGKARRQ